MSVEPAIRAIETNYKGHRFRSRLEARWAVFFDSLEIKWQYEPQGFAGDNGEQYLPDFYFPKTGTWIEVKGSNDALLEKQCAHKIDSVVDNLPGVIGSYGRNGVVNGLLLLGEIPEPRYGIQVHSIYQHCAVENSGTFQFVVFVPGGPRLIGKWSEIKFLWKWLGNVGPGFSVENVFCDTGTACHQTITAYKKARSARFEHGENGT